MNGQLSSFAVVVDCIQYPATALPVNNPRWLLNNCEAVACKQMVNTADLNGESSKKMYMSMMKLQNRASRMKCYGRKSAKLQTNMDPLGIS